MSESRTGGSNELEARAEARREIIRDVCSQIIASAEDRMFDAISVSNLGPEAEQMRLFSSGSYYSRECDTVRMNIPKEVQIEAASGSAIDTRSGFNQLSIRRPIDLAREIYAELHPLTQKPEVNLEDGLSETEIARLHDNLTRLEEENLTIDELFEITPDKEDGVEDDLSVDELFETHPDSGDLNTEEVHEFYGFLTEFDPDEDRPYIDGITTFRADTLPRLLIVLRRSHEDSDHTRVTLGIYDDDIKIMADNDPWRVYRVHNGLKFMPYLVNFIDAGEIIETNDPNKDIGGEEGQAVA